MTDQSIIDVIAEAIEDAERSCGPGEYWQFSHHVVSQLRERYATIVGLPEPQGHVWKVLIGGEPEDLYVGTQDGDIFLSGHLQIDSTEARDLAAALLAVANAAEAYQ